MLDGIRMEVGDGIQTQFQNDISIEFGRMRENFPRLYSLSNQKGCFVGDCGFWDGHEWTWNFQWRRRLFQWELDLLNELHNALAIVKLNRFSKDRLIWKFDQEVFC